MKQTKMLFAVLFSLLAIPFIIGCGGGGSSATATTQTGTLALNLKDAPGDFKAVCITIKEVQVHMSGDGEEQEASSGTEDNAVAEDQEVSDDSGWTTVADLNKTFDLLKLQNGVEAALGEENLTVGHYTQMRLVLLDALNESVTVDENSTECTDGTYANYVVIEDVMDDYNEPIIIPSSYQTGIKLIKGFDIEANTTTTLTLDFDANKSISMQGNDDWKMKPTIKIIQE